VDPYLVPQTSARNRLLRLVWNTAYICFFRLSPRPFYAWRRFVLRLFGARLDANVRVAPTAQIWAPWNLTCEDLAVIGPHVIVYNPKPLHIGSHAIVSQQAYLCGATHDYEDPSFPTISFPMRLGAYSWVCARASVQPGANLGDGAVLALGAVATCDLECWTVYGGVPARKIKARLVRPIPS
jgi:putative colanic acid biosynthesis acetyltransferase WcaF